METILLALAFQTPIMDAAAFGEMTNPTLIYNEGEVASANLIRYANKCGLCYKTQVCTVNNIRYWYQEIQKFPKVFECPMLPSLAECRRACLDAEKQVEYYTHLQRVINREVPQLDRQKYRLEIWRACSNIMYIKETLGDGGDSCYRFRMAMDNLRNIIGQEAFMRWEIPGPIE